ncbi:MULTISPECIES: hypothetical protein [unclassified Streptomyces]|uniref:hypothetical protein n=1 Tax=unclassified Streptomyces TaxID=2593676 RepID=UPI0004C1DF84|nr:MULTISPECIES: hypothetical protein [unclassified Streptomyces]
MNSNAKGKSASQYNLKGLLLGLVIVGLVGAGVVFFFVKGLYLLPGKVCEKSVQRDIAVRALPRARVADQWADQHGSGRDFVFNCTVSTSGNSVLSGRVALQDTSASGWVDFYRQSAGHHVVSVSKNGVEALAQTDSDRGFASVYVPCVPRDVEANTASDGFALVAQAQVSGESRATGRELSQVVTDFAYQLSRHAYELAECKAQRDFPAELPRYEDR